MSRSLLVCTVGLVGWVAGIADAQAQPYPGCPFVTYTVYSVCSERPGVPGFTPGFTLTPGVPGTSALRGPTHQFRGHAGYRLRRDRLGANCNQLRVSVRMETRKSHRLAGEMQR